jgi:transcription-repair coupling factor (superfamily II helicase)
MQQLNLSGLVPVLKTASGYRDLIRDLRGPRGHSRSDHPALLSANPPSSVNSRRRRSPLGVLEAARPAVIAALQRDLNVPILVVTAHAERARHLAEQARAFASRPGSVHLFPSPDALPYERVPWDVQTIRDRLRVLAGLHARWEPAGPSADKSSDTPAPLIVADVRGMLQRTLPPAEFAAARLTVRQGQRIELRQLLVGLVGLGYTIVPVVEAPGEASHRGGIVDVYPPALDRPVRTEFFGDEIDSLRYFDPASQRSEEVVPAVTLTPAHEALPGRGPEAARRLAACDWSHLHPLAEAEFARQRQALADGLPFAGIELYLPELHPTAATVLDYLPPDAVILVEDWRDVESAGLEAVSQMTSLRDAQVRSGELPRGWESPLLVSWERLEQQLTTRPVSILGHNGRSDGHPVSLAFQAAPRYGGQLHEVIADCQQWSQAGQTVILVSRQAQRIADLFAESDTFLEPVEGLTQPPQPGTIVLVEGILAEGWKLEVGDSRLEVGEPSNFRLPTPNLQPPASIILITDGELFGWRMPRARRAPKRQAPPPEAFFADVAPGDYVVHIEHGIGIYRGLVRLDANGTEREYLEIEYDRGDKLYVPTYQVDRVARYVGVGDRAPRITRLGGADWERVKERAKRAVEEIAQELLALYAARETVPGYAFSLDTPWQAELEASFPHVETEDQLRVIEEVKADMERGRPMDRLIAGDVGYGKTEVALRAAFKAVMDGKQVAVLVPTTILAQQHFGTFQQRLAAFPVEIEMLSRFRNRAEQKDILQRLAKGRIDIVIGTHRLLQKDVMFKDLGLLIIDEEQRFGVEHKERLKQMRKEVDVLTLTATPIPRTLHMSLSGIRDLSTIDTPPEERLPVITQVAEYDDALIRQAILRELSRDGQVYFVHNRVQGIHLIAQKVQRLMPEARVAMAHGQMDEAELARVMLDFAAGHFDVLVCTSIIESGLDIPNANTLIVNRADRFGLAQLYQLRGRVGRGSQRAYAYLLYDKHAVLSPEARERLNTILEASELGAGFRIAMRDLEIRGAGEILGERQSGHIVAVGFDLYTRLLAQAVRDLQEKSKVESSESRVEPQVSDLGLSTWGLRLSIDLPLSAYLPEEYVPDADLRLRLYRRMAQLTDLSDVDAIAQELEDRFGGLPEPARNLVYLLRLKVLAARAGIEGITREGHTIVLRLSEGNEEVRKRLQARLDGKARVGRSQVWVSIRPSDAWRDDLRQVLEIMAET